MLRVWEQFRLLHFGDSNRQMCDVPFPWAPWQNRVAAGLAALTGLGLLRVRGEASTLLTFLLWVILPIQPVQKGSCGTISSGKKSPPSQQAASWDVVGYFG